MRRSSENDCGDWVETPDAATCLLTPPVGFEPTTGCLEGSCSKPKVAAEQWISRNVEPVA